MNNRENDDGRLWGDFLHVAQPYSLNSTTAPLPPSLHEYSYIIQTPQKFLSRVFQGGPVSTVQRSEYKGGSIAKKTLCHPLLKGAPQLARWNLLNPLEFLLYTDTFYKRLGLSLRLMTTMAVKRLAKHLLFVQRKVEFIKCLLFNLNSFYLLSILLNAFNPNYHCIIDSSFLCSLFNNS